MVKFPKPTSKRLHFEESLKNEASIQIFIYGIQYRKSIIDTVTSEQLLIFLKFNEIFEMADDTLFYKSLASITITVAPT